MKNILTSCLILGVISCNSPKAEDFREKIDGQERVAFHIVAGKDGYESRKLKSLLDEDYDGALKAVDRKSKAFDKIIFDIKKMQTLNVDEASALKGAAINYYEALKKLHAYDRKEIIQQLKTKNVDSSQLPSEQKTLLNIYREKKSFYEDVYERESLYSEAKRKFDEANGL
ncbi:hypothetical protein LUD75_07025 [Epilithonimonas sp. JDS]|uniref:hypothetical protein n=1 Tax=Epilithonimonas sp. JDS TaxID=2902797 RepID=UPI001E357254|nr:hypothetical protein [Epilithonimonas sp. JDS]MCD9854451.1 hypothetical protein [Epilithonimonas sp. JDS]